MKLASFDIFDTTLIRKCGRPENVFWLLARRLFPNNIDRQQAFVTWRNSAPSKGWGNDYKSLDDIYEEDVCKRIFNKPSSFLKKEERLIESDLLVANKEVLSIIENYRSKGYTIAFISDMYLDSAFLKNVLIREGTYKEGDYIYISNECKARKDSGELYDYVKNVLHPQKWFHYGDNKLSDYVKARNKNLRAILVSQNYHPSECDVIEFSKSIAYPFELSTLAGECRAERINYGNSAEVVLAADFVAPAYIPYVMHVIKDSKQRNIKKLFFLSRDAYILYKIAEQIPHEGIELKYLFVSRKSLFLPYLYKASENDYLRLFMNNQTLKGSIVNKLLADLGLSKADVEFNFDKIESEEQERIFLDTIFKDCSVFSKWQHIAKAQNELACGYLEQEGVFSNHVALVDVGWYGTARMMINKLCKQHDAELCFTYYWGIMKNVLCSQYGDFDYFIKELNINQWITYIVEDYFSHCPYSTTISYKYKNNQIVPVLASNNSNKESYIFKINKEIVVKLAQKVVNYQFDEQVLYHWASVSFKSMNSRNYYINYGPLLEVGGKEEFVFRRLSLIDVVLLVCGKNVTINDSVALDEKCGIKARKIIMKIHNVMRNLYLSSCILNKCKQPILTYCMKK